MQTKLKNINFPLWAIFLVALFFRLFDLDDPFPTSDHISVSHFVIKNFSFNAASLKNIISYYHGSAAPLLGFITAGVSLLLHIPLTEAVWRVPFSLLGSLVVFPLFSLGKQISGKWAGWSAAFLVAIYPWHVYISRSPGLGHKSFSIFLQVLAIAALLHFIKSPNFSHTRNLAVILTLVILFDIFFPFTLIALLLIGLYSFENINQFKKFFREEIIENKLLSFVIIPVVTLFFILLIKESLKVSNLSLMNALDAIFDLILPFGLFLFYLFLFFAYKFGVFKKSPDWGRLKKKTFLWLLPILAILLQIFSLISHLGSINQGRNVTDGWGFYGKEFLYNALHFSAIPILIPLVFFLIRGIWQLKRKKNIGVLVLWALAFIAPFLFMFSRLPTFYFPIVITSLIVLAGISMTDSINSPRVSSFSKFFYVAIYIFISSLFLLLTIGGLAGSDKITSWQKKIARIKCNPDCGELIYPDYGIKAAAYWFRTSTPLDTSIFVYSVGSVPFEPPTLDYYLRRPNTSLYNASFERINQLFKSNISGINYLMITADELSSVEEEVNSNLFLRVTVVGENGPVLFIYSRQPGSQEIIESRAGARLFDKYFVNRKNLFL